MTSSTVRNTAVVLELQSVAFLSAIKMLERSRSTNLEIGSRVFILVPIEVPPFPGTTLVRYFFMFCADEFYVG